MHIYEKYLKACIYPTQFTKTIICKLTSKALVSSNAAGFPTHYIRYSGPQLMILRVLVAFTRTTRMHTSCFRLADIIYPEPAYSYSASRIFWLRFMTWFHTKSSQLLTLDSHPVWRWIWGYCNTLFFMNGLTHVLPYSQRLHGARHKCLYMCSYSSCGKTLLTVVCVPTASRDAQALGLGISTPNWAHYVYTILIKRHKAAIQNTPTNSVLLVLSCILPAWYISCWMTFKADSFLLFIS